jgi:heparin binding hemagglutinin HbhA
MSENTTPNSNPQSGQDKDSSDLMKELREMGHQLETAFRTTIESDRAKQLQQDIVGGVRELAGQVQSAVKSLQDNPRVQQAEQRGRQAVEQARESKVVQDIQETIVTGLAQLNAQLRKVVDRLESEANKPSGPASQNVPADQEPPATGETTRLDE